MIAHLILALDVLIGGAAGLAYWFALAVWLAVPDAPHPLACIACGVAGGLVSRMMRRAAE